MSAGLGGSTIAGPNPPAELGTVLDALNATPSS